jgi:hypothetical protein
VESPANYEPRYAPLFNEVYQAVGFTFVTVRFEGGRTTPVEMLVGDANPPTVSLGVVRAEYGSASWMVRPDEYWELRCRRDDGGGFTALATPMYQAPSVGGRL